MPAAKRTFLGKANRYGNRQRVYLKDDCIEVDELDHYDIFRRRVFFEDVIAITYHRYVGWASVLSVGLGAAFFLTLAAIIASHKETRVAVFFLVLALPFVVLAALRLALQVDTITVFGKRTKAEMYYYFRKARARDTHARLIRLVRERQEALAAQYAAEAPPPEPPPQGGLPPPPALSAGAGPPAPS